MKKLLTLLLAAALLLPCFMTGCNLFEKPEVTTPEATTPEQTTPEATTPEQTTPDTSIEIPPEPLTMKLTSVNVVTGTDMSVAYAGAELLTYLTKKGITVTSEGFPIYIEIDETLGMDSFLIESSLEENIGMTIKGGNTRGVIYAVYRFLKSTQDSVTLPPLWKLRPMMTLSFPMAL